MATGNVTARIQELGREASERAFHEHERLALRGPTLFEEIQDFVFEYPVRTLLFGLGTGLIIASALVRR